MIKETHKQWIFYEGGSKKLNEVLLARHIVQTMNLHFVANNFVDTFGDLENDKVEKAVYAEVSSEFSSPTTKAANVLKLVKVFSLVEQELPAPMKIYTQDKAYSLEKNKLIEDKNDCFTLLRFNYRYIKKYAKPETWINFLKGIFHDEDINTLQEFMGYCLLPMTVAQEALVIIGKGGEGKSVIGQVIQHIWHNKAIMDKIQNLDIDRFLVSQLINKLVFIDDDLDPKKLEKTGMFKQLVTNNNKILVEDKYSSKFPAHIYCRFLMFGNNAIQSLYDRSNGFFRRIKIIRCKQISKDRTEDKLFFDKLLPEMENIFNWCIDGLLRLAANGFKISESIYSSREKEELKSDSVNIYDFIESSYVEMDGQTRTTSARIYKAYLDWCAENATAAISLRSFTSFLKDNQDTFYISYDKNISIENGRLARGFKGIKISYHG